MKNWHEQRDSNNKIGAKKPKQIYCLPLYILLNGKIYKVLKKFMKHNNNNNNGKQTNKQTNKRI
jgi:hypothetical protein